MYLNSLRIINFLDITDLTTEFNKYSIIKNINVLKTFHILKLLISISEEHPEITSLIDNEIRPNSQKEISFEVKLNIHGYNYEYKISIYHQQITYEHLLINTEKQHFIYKRLNNELIYEDEPIIWNCPNSVNKTFLNTCASKNNKHGQNFYYFFKENILGNASWIKNSLNDDIINLYNQENLTDSVVDLIKKIPVVSLDKVNLNYFNYPDSIQQLNLLIKDKYHFHNLNDLETRSFLKILIYLGWLDMIGGGIFLLDDTLSLKFLDYLEICSCYYQNIQFMIYKQN